MSHDDDDDEDDREAPQVVALETPEQMKAFREAIEGIRKPSARLAVALTRRSMEPVLGSLPLVTSEPKFSVSIFLTCTGCQERVQMVIAGHHVATVHRVLGEILQRYPEECVELFPSTEGAEQVIAGDAGRGGLQ